MVDIALLFILTEYAGIWYLASSVLSFILGSLSHFYVSRRWVFAKTEKSFWRQYGSFFLIHLGGITINTTALYILVEYCHIYYIIAKILTVVLGVSWTFFANTRFTFKSPPSLPKIISE
jgi:dolichol-phosphate mannosyltransferase